MTTYEYLSPEEVAEALMLRLDDVFARMASGELFAMRLPGNDGLVLPRPLLPPVTKVTEHEL